MKNKLGTYISNLMATIVDEQEKQFVKDLAFDELKRLDVDIKEFLRKHLKDDTEESEKTVKQLLQEKKNGKNSKSNS